MNTNDRAIEKLLRENRELRRKLREADALIASIERFGTYLDPRHYGDKYDHHTFTRIATEEGKWVAVYRLDDDALAAYDAQPQTTPPMMESVWPKEVGKDTHEIQPQPTPSPEGEK